MRIYILSRGALLYSTRRIYEAAKNAQHEVRIIDHMQCDLLIQHNTYQVVYNDEIILKPDIVIPRIGASVTAYGITVVRHFHDMGATVLNMAVGIYNSRDKFRSMQLMASQNIGLPTTYFSHDLHQAEKIVDKILGYPFIIKVIEGTQGVGVHLVKSKKEAHEMFEVFYASRTQILLQEFIEEFKGKDIRVFVVGNKVVASMMRVAGEGEFRSNLHRGGMGHNVELTSQEKEMAVNAVKILGLNVAGVDILRSKRGPLIIEVNSSPGLEGIEGVTKVKIAEEIIRFAELKHTHEDL